MLTSTVAFAAKASATPATPAAAKAAGIQVIHREALPVNGGISTLDVNPGWTENVEMRLTTSTKFQILTITAICTLLFKKFGGKTADYKGFATTLIGGGITLESNQAYQKVRYYWQTSGDPQYPYYVKQVIYNYSDQARTKLVYLNTRYYYSNLSF